MIANKLTLIAAYKIKCNNSLSHNDKIHP